jgi:hypothetical protein
MITSSNPLCPATNITVAAATGLTIPVAAGATNAAGSILNVVTMDTGAPDACQGVSFTIALTLTGSQS